MEYGIPTEAEQVPMMMRAMDTCSNYAHKNPELVDWHAMEMLGLPPITVPNLDQCIVDTMADLLALATQRGYHITCAWIEDAAHPNGGHAFEMHKIDCDADDALKGTADALDAEVTEFLNEGHASSEDGGQA